MKQRYEYSSELKGMGFQTDYDMADLVLSGKMEKILHLLSFEVKCFRSHLAEIEKKYFLTDDAVRLPFYEFTPKKADGRLPAILYFHGGGFMFPIQKAMMKNSCLYAANCGVKVFLPEYRLVPNVNCDRLNKDCYEMLSYMFLHADELQIDPNRIILYGDSAGGCLAANAAIRNRDEDRFPLLAQMLLYPVCDSESFRYASMNEYEYAVWSKKANASMWKLYFHNGCVDTSRVVPIKNDCRNLPQAYVEVLEMDVLRDEGIAYADKLKASGVRTECNLIGGAYHGYDMELNSPLVQRVFQHRYKVINDYLTGKGE